MQTVRIHGLVRSDDSTLDSVGPSSSTEILASVVQGVAVLVVNLRPTRTEAFVHAHSRTHAALFINPQHDSK